MPSPNIPPRFSPFMADIYQRLHAIAESDRMTSLVDYLDDLCLEFDWVSVELKKLGFCAASYLADRDDGDDHDYVEAD